MLNGNLCLDVFIIITSRSERVNECIMLALIISHFYYVDFYHVAEKMADTNCSNVKEGRGRGSKFGNMRVPL